MPDRSSETTTNARILVVPKITTAVPGRLFAPFISQIVIIKFKKRFSINKTKIEHSARGNNGTDFKMAGNILI